TSALSLLSLSMSAGYGSVRRPGHHPQRAAAQSEGDHGRAAAARADRDHRPLRLGKELSRLRHAVCRGAAALHRVTLHLRQAVPRADAEAPGGRHRRHLARGGHRAEKPDHDEPLDGGHGDGDLRLPAPPVGPGGDALLREVRAGGGAGVLVVVERVGAADASRGRLADAVATAFSEGEGVAVMLENGSRRRFSEHPTCSSCGTPAPVLAPSLFSFNNPRGACPACNGFGAVLEYDESLIVPDARRTLAQGALDPWTKPRYEGRRRLLR